MTRWRLTSHRRSAAWALALAAALLCAQALGLAHRVWHAPGLHATVQDGLGHAAGDRDCRLVDALAAADLLAGAPALPPPCTPATPPRVAVVGEGGGARSGAAYLARGPPRG